MRTKYKFMAIYFISYTIFATIYFLFDTYSNKDIASSLFYITAAYSSIMIAKYFTIDRR